MESGSHSEVFVNGNHTRGEVKEEEGEEENLQDAQSNRMVNVSYRKQEHNHYSDDGNANSLTQSEEKSKHPDFETDASQFDSGMSNKNLDSTSNNSKDELNSEQLENFYDDTKPKRLKQTKKIKLDLKSKSDMLMQGIDVLISPDEHSHRSPTRRKGISGSTSPIHLTDRPFLPYGEMSEKTDKVAANENVINNSQHNESYLPTENVEQNINLDRNHLDSNGDKIMTINDCSNESGYRSDSSGEISIPCDADKTYKNTYPTRVSTHDQLKIASPTEDQINHEVSNGQESCKTEERTIVYRDGSRFLQPSRRKMSPDPLIRKSDEQRIVPRKLSADANLERRYKTAQEINDAQPLRKRRVSFGMVAYIKGDDGTGKQISPLNDEIRLFVNSGVNPVTSEAMKETSESVAQDKIESKADNDQQLPKFQTASERESLAAKDNYKYYLSDDMYDGDESLTIGNHQFENPAFVNDEVDVEGKNNNPESETQLNSDQGTNQGLPKEKYFEKKISTHSLPVGIGFRDTKRLSWQSDDSPMPKSILKNKTASSDSLTSESSTNEKRFKVRKDSIALFTDQHGQIGLAELRKQYSSDWKSRLNLKTLWSKRRELLSSYKTNIFVFGLFSCIVTFVVVGLYLHNIHKENLAIAQKVFFDAKARRLHLHDKDENDQVSATLGLNIPKWLLPSHCYADYEDIHDRTCLIWKGFGELNIQYMDNEVKCYNVSWKMKPGVKPYDCFNVGNNYWYGPSNSSANNWPIDLNGFSFDTSSVKHYNSGTFEFVTEYYWLATNGGAVFVDSSFPLHVHWNKRNKRNMCVSVSKTGDFYSKDNTGELSMNYVICNGENLLDTHKFVSEQFIPKLQEIPDVSLMISPHWSTVSPDRNKKVNESVILDLSRMLSHHNLNCSTIELDGQWEQKVGDFSFSKNAFPNITNTLKVAADAKCKFSLYLFPYFDISSSNFLEGLSREVFIKSIGKQVPALVKWQHGLGAMLDVSNSTARSWFTNKIKALKSLYGIDIFRFAYGKSFWLPHKPVFSQEKLSPNKVKKMFSDLFSSFGDIVIKSTSRTQHISGFIGIPSSIVNHEEIKCLKNIIPDILNLGHLGYPFVMSDGFEIENIVEAGDKPNRDLFIRWMQLSAFFPSMRYTIKPWKFDQEVISLARNLSEFHRSIVIPEIKKLEAEILQGRPIVRPLWWLDPYDGNAFQINDQFLLGDKYLVAPILCEGESGFAERDIYVPKGIWRDIISNTIIPGPKKIRGYRVHQNDIPYFKREELHFSVQR